MSPENILLLKYLRAKKSGDERASCSIGKEKLTSYENQGLLCLNVEDARFRVIALLQKDETSFYVKIIHFVDAYPCEQ